MATHIFHLQKDDTIDLSPNFVDMDSGDTISYSTVGQDIVAVDSQGVVTVVNTAEVGEVGVVRVNSAQQGYLTSFFFIIQAADGNAVTTVEDDVTIDVKSDVIITFLRADPNTKVQIRDVNDNVVSEINTTPLGFARVVATRAEVKLPDSEVVVLKVARVINNEAKAVTVNMSETRVISKEATGTVLPEEQKVELKTPLPTTTRIPSTTTTTTVAPTTTTTTTTTSAPTGHSYGEGGYGDGPYGGN